MDLIDRLRELSARIAKQIEQVHTEEATKTAFVMPFINALGYSVFDPSEVVPEFTADVGTKKGEKVDYAVMRDGKPIILFECKAVGSALDMECASQLYRYFSVTEARFGVLTDGVVYRFFSDLEEPNRMDSRPFLEFSMLEITDQAAEEIKKFAKDSFDLDDILSTAADLKYTGGIKRVLAEEWANPSEDMVRLLAGRVYSGRMTQAAREQFTAITRKAFQQFITDRVNDRLKSAMEGGEAADRPDDTDRQPPEDYGEEEETGEGIVTTQEEIDAYYIVKSIVREVVSPQRVSMRDRKSYCAILLDDNGRRPICRLWFNTSQKYVGLFDEKKDETRHPIDDLNEIYGFADQLIATVVRYDPTAKRGTQAGNETGASDGTA